MYKLVTTGSFKRTERFLNALKGKRYLNLLDKYGRLGVEALKDATPRDTGKTADSWSYKIFDDGHEHVSIVWTNENMAGKTNIPVAVLIQYGHATKSGGWVEGIDYINPALEPIFKRIAEDVWKEIERV